MGKDGEPTMERPSHPQQKFLKQHTHTPPSPILSEETLRKFGGRKRK